MSKVQKIEVSLEHGYTIVELVTVIIIIGIIGAMAAPKFFDNNIFQERGFRDQVVATLRYAQKAAIAQHRYVCVGFTATTVTLTFDPASTTHAPVSCTQPMTLPGGTTNFITAPNSNVTLTGYQQFSFDFIGKPTVPNSITVTGSTVVTVEAETGYVH